MVALTGEVCPYGCAVFGSGVAACLRRCEHLGDVLPVFNGEQFLRYERLVIPVHIVAPEYVCVGVGNEPADSILSAVGSERRECGGVEELGLCDSHFCIPFGLIFIGRADYSPRFHVEVVELTEHFVVNGLADCVVGSVIIPAIVGTASRHSQHHRTSKCRCGCRHGNLFPSFQSFVLHKIFSLAQ